MEIGWGEGLVVFLGVLLILVLYRRYRRKAKEIPLVEEYCGGFSQEETQKFLALWRIYRTGTDEEYETMLGTVGDRVERAFQRLLDDEAWRGGPFSDWS